MKKVFVVAIALLAISCASMDKKVHSMSTPELKLRHTQVERELSGVRWGEKMTNEFADLEKERDAIELELLHRYQSGDSAAYLPTFRH